MSSPKKILILFTLFIFITLFQNNAFAQNEQTIVIPDELQISPGNIIEIKPTLIDQIEQVEEKVQDISEKIENISSNLDEFRDSDDGISADSVIDLISNILNFASGITDSKISIITQIDDIIGEISIETNEEKKMELIQELNDLKTKLNAISTNEGVFEREKLEEILQHISDPRYGLDKIKNEVQRIETEIGETNESLQGILAILTENFSKTESTATKIFVQDKKITLTKRLSFWSFADTSSFDITIKNVGKHDATNVHIIPGDLTIKGNSNLGYPLEKIDYGDITLSPDIFPILEKGKSETISYTIPANGWDETAYEGQVYLQGDDFEAVTIEVESQIITDPALLAIFGFVGMTLAILTGLILINNEKEKEYQKHIQDDNKILSHINSHIKEINKFKNVMSSDEWNTIRRLYYEKRSVIRSAANNLILEENEDSLWFERISNNLQMKLRVRCENNQSRNSNIGTKEFFEKIISTKKLEIYNDILKSKKIDSNKQKDEIEFYNEMVEFLDELIQDCEKLYNDSVPLDLLESAFTERQSRIKNKIIVWTNEEKVKSMMNEWNDICEEIIKKITDEPKNKINNDSNNHESFRINLEDKIELTNIVKDTKFVDNDEKIEKIFADIPSGDNYVKKLETMLGNIDNSNIKKSNLEKRIIKLNEEKTEIDAIQTNYSKIKKERIQQKRLAERKDTKKQVYFLATILISIPGGIFVADSFTGPMWTNLLISLITGFGIYKIKDIRDLFVKPLS